MGVGKVYEAWSTHKYDTHVGQQQKQNSDIKYKTEAFMCT